MAAKESFKCEYAALVSLTDKITLGISSDCSTIAQKLEAVGLIPPKSLNSEAVDIFDKVLKAVELNPECYEKFLAVIRECYWMKSLSELIQARYQEKKQQTKEEDEASVDTEESELTTLRHRVKQLQTEVKELRQRETRLREELQTKEAVISKLQQNNQKQVPTYDQAESSCLLPPGSLILQNAGSFLHSASASEISNLQNKDITDRDLIRIQWVDGTGSQKTLKLLEGMSSKWQDIGSLIGIDGTKLDSYASQHRSNPGDCIRAVVNDWKMMCSKRYPATWDGLLKLLKDAELNKLAKDFCQAANASWSSLLNEN